VKLTIKTPRMAKWTGGFLAGLGIILLIAGCSSPSDRKILSFFFDGVPDGATPQKRVVPASFTNVPADPVENVRAVLPKEPELCSHPPFIQHRCNDCHEGRNGMALLAPTLTLCFNCHTNFLNGNESKHQPVEAGDCQLCHAPHQSPNKRLLLKTGKDLCYDCHDDLTQKSKSAHQPVENGECLSCHAPHASSHKKLVTKAAPALCWDCHDNFLEKAAFSHDPVSDCGVCHNPHAGAEQKLLAKPSNTLCFDCHEEKDVKNVDAHAATGGKTCLTCHDPHVGKNKNLLTSAGLAAEPKGDKGGKAVKP
jgi:predicted CXXCH cytochrome family protein